jgi:hypothetical protein
MRSLGSLASTIVADALRRQPVSRGKIEFAWRMAVGGTIFRATTIALLDDGTLRVAAASPHWRREVVRSITLIEERLKTYLGNDVVRRIVIPE